MSGLDLNVMKQYGRKYKIPEVPLLPSEQSGIKFAPVDIVVGTSFILSSMVDKGEMHLGQTKLAVWVDGTDLDRDGGMGSRKPGSDEKACPPLRTLAAAFHISRCSHVLTTEPLDGETRRVFHEELFGVSSSATTATLEWNSGAEFKANATAAGEQISADFGVSKAYYDAVWAWSRRRVDLERAYKNADSDHRPIPLVLIASDSEKSDKSDKWRVVFEDYATGLPTGSHVLPAAGDEGKSTSALKEPLAYVIYGSLKSFKCDEKNNGKDEDQPNDKDNPKDELYARLKNHAGVDKKYVDVLFATKKQHRALICEVVKKLRQKGMEVPNFMLNAVQQAEIDRTESNRGKGSQPAVAKTTTANNGNTEPTQDGTRRASSADEPRSSSPSAKNGKKRHHQRRVTTGSNDSQSTVKPS